VPQSAHRAVAAKANSANTGDGSPAAKIREFKKAAWQSSLGTLASDKNIIVPLTHEEGEEAVPAVAAPDAVAAASKASTIREISKAAWRAKSDALASNKGVVMPLPSRALVPEEPASTRATARPAWMQACGAYDEADMTSLPPPIVTKVAAAVPAAASTEPRVTALATDAVPPATTAAAKLRENAKKAWQSKREALESAASDKGAVAQLSQPVWMVACGAYDAEPQAPPIAASAPAVATFAEAPREASTTEALTAALAAAEALDEAPTAATDGPPVATAFVSKAAMLREEAKMAWQAKRDKFASAASDKGTVAQLRRPGWMEACGAY